MNLTSRRFGFRKSFTGVLAALSLCWGALAPFSAAHAQDKTCALVLMHGKGGAPREMSFFGRKMEPPCVFKSVEMPWSQRRAYDQPYPVALQDIAAVVKEYRSQGYQRVLLVGHSFGANAGMAYMAALGDADGVIALAPGHSPRHMYNANIGRAAVDKARELVATGKGSETLTMDDLNQGKRTSPSMSAETLLSYFDPDGLGDMPTSAAKFKKPVPFLWVIGMQDPLYRAGQAYAFDKVPAHPHSQYLVVQAGHLDTPDVAAAQVLAWIKALP